MLRLTLDLHGARTKKRHAVGELMIWNEGGLESDTLGNYSFLISHEGVDGVHRTGEGELKGFPRDLGAWELVKQVLEQKVTMETHTERLMRQVLEHENE